VRFLLVDVTGWRILVRGIPRPFTNADFCERARIVPNMLSLISIRRYMRKSFRISLVCYARVTLAVRTVDANETAFQGTFPGSPFHSSNCRSVFPHRDLNHEASVVN
jgi:hypothetical protein